MPFKKGIAANPNGRPRGTQSFVDRAKYWLETKTAKDIAALMADPKAKSKLSVFDSMIVTRIHEAIQPGGHKSMNDLLDRVIGRPTQYVKQDIKTDMDILKQEALQELRDLSKEELLAIRAIVDGDTRLAPT